MSVRVMSLVWDSRVESSKKFVLLYYADRAGDEGENVWPAVDTVAEKTGFTRRTVQRLTKEMVDLCLLTPSGKSRKGTNLYCLNLEAIRNYTEKETKKEGGDIDAISDGVTLTPLGGDIDAIEGVTLTPKRGDTATPDTSLTTIEPSINHKCCTNSEKPENSEIEARRKILKEDKHLSAWGMTGIYTKPKPEFYDVLAYPEDIQQILKKFLSLWEIKKIPAPKDKDFAWWIGKLRALSIAQEDFSEIVLDRVYEDWQKKYFSVNNPGALINAVEGMVVKLRSEKKGTALDYEIIYDENGDRTGIRYFDPEKQRESEEFDRLLEERERLKQMKKVSVEP